jgi:hypothetical protein
MVIQDERGTSRRAYCSELQIDVFCIHGCLSDYNPTT